MSWHCSEKGSSRTREGNEWQNEPGACSMGRGQGLWQAGARFATEIHMQKNQRVQFSC